MEFLLSVVALLFSIRCVDAKAVFAHFMVTNTQNYSSSDWSNEIQLAQEAHIQAFALNMAFGDPVNEQGVAAAFNAAQGTGFQLFFSFDYAGMGAWDPGAVIDFLNKYSSNSAYYQYNGQPFVSTFEGPESASDWTDIKAKTGVFLMPDWSSRGAKAALELSNGIADGLFSWAGWPWGPNDMNTYVDASYVQYLEGKPYMMPVSPWFYTNLPGYNKNWLWRGDDTWFDRWNEVLYIQPEFVEIQTWNDYGESHYIGPLRDNAYAAFDIGRGPFNYAANMPHDAWRLTLPYTIDMYLNNASTLTQELLTVWFRPNPATACDTGGTTGNTATQLQLEFQPGDIVQNRIYFSVLAVSKPTSLTVTIGGADVPASWTDQPDSGIGLYHGSTDSYGSRTGQVIVTVSTEAGTMKMASDSGITTECTNGIMNWNAWTGSALGGSVHTTTPRLDHAVCIDGEGVNNFGGLCSWACSLGYCPVGACNCLAMGTQRPKPKPTPINGYPLEGEDASYSGLCAFDCGNGYCPENACGTTAAPLSTPTVSDFLPPACNGGEGDGNYAGLCSFSCTHGFCPIHICRCTSQGGLNDLPPSVDTTGYAVAGNDYGLCDFTCKRGYCPSAVCGSTGGAGNNGPNVYPSVSIWNDPSPTVGCKAPCTIVLPPYPLGYTTVVQWPPLITTFLSSASDGCSVVTSTIDMPPFTTTEIAFWPVTIYSTDGGTATFTPVQSVMPPSFSITLGANVATFKPTHVSGEDTTSTDACAIATFSSTPYVVPIQPLPVYPLPLSTGRPPGPGPFPPGPIVFDDGIEGPLCDVRCPIVACALLGCDHNCGIFGCDGGCSIFGCGPTCGLDGCSTDCSLVNCGPLECSDGSCGDEGSGAEITACSIGPGPSPTSSCTSGLSEPTATSLTYAVYPQDGTDSGQTTSIQATLAGLVNDPTDVHETSFDPVEVYFWTLPLSPQSALTLATDPRIANVHVVCGDDCYDATTGALMRRDAPTIVRQKSAMDETVFISQEKGTDLKDYMGNYYFDQRAGGGTRVYVLDTGASLLSTEFTEGINIASRARYLFIDKDPNGGGHYNKNMDDGDDRGHGTCMLGRICGHVYGTAKDINPVVVKLGKKGFFTPEDVINGLSKIQEDVKSNGGGKRTVLLMALYYPKEFLNDAQQTAMYQILAWLIGQGMTIVTGSGNQNRDTVDGFPASWGSDSTESSGLYLDGLIVVGATNPEGERWFERSTLGSNFDHERMLPHIYAPGWDVQCAARVPYYADVDVRIGSGTSQASATTAGLVAYLLSIDTEDLDPSGVKSLVMALGWERVPGIKAIWNGVTKSQIPESCPTALNGPPEPDCNPFPPTPTERLIAAYVRPAAAGASDYFAFYDKTGPELDAENFYAEICDLPKKVFDTVPPPDSDPTHPPSPKGSFDLSDLITSRQGCTYSSVSDNSPGFLQCSDLNIQCSIDGVDTEQNASVKCGDDPEMFVSPVVNCEWP